MEDIKKAATETGASGETEHHFAHDARKVETQRIKATGHAGRRSDWFKQRAILVVLASSVLSAAPKAIHAQAADQSQTLQQRVDTLTSALAEVQARLDALEGHTSAKGNAAAQEQSAQKEAAALRAAATAIAPLTQPLASGVPTCAQSTPDAPAQMPACNPKPPAAAPGTRPGSTTPSVGGVSPAEVYNLTLGANQPTTAEQANHKFLEKKPGKDLTFYTRTGEITLYGNLDVSVDSATKGLNGVALGTASGPPVGNGGWLEDISTNLAYVGVRGTQMTGLKDTNFIFQLETSINISTAPGLHESNSQQQDTVDGTLFTRNSYVGLGRVKWGALLFGKTDPPYKQSTARMNPFNGMEGDYQVIIGNTGGDNRVEFGYRLDHSIWYTSPKLRGYQWNVLFSPGQNRASDSGDIPAGEPDCTGGDQPGDGGLAPIACNDGGFSDVVSANVSYTKEPLYITAAYERHMKVNRQSDMTGIYSGAPPSNYSGPITTNDPSYTGPGTTFVNGPGYLFWVPTSFYNAEVADEDAGKVGIQYGFFNRKTVLSALVESLHRYVPGYLEWQNERQRLGSWLAATQAIGRSDSLSIGWARAYRAPGDPCQHSDCFNLAPYSAPADGDMTAGRGMNNQADMFTVAYRHRIGDGLEIYSDWAGTYNDQYAHFDLGAGGRGVTTDCHDASGATGNEFSDPHCWTGVHLKAVSIGLDKRF
jgi:predicted porin/cytoskeletal protein RodZ